MRGNILLVVNTNVLFSFFGKSTTTRELIFLLSGRLISPEFAISELEEHKEEVLRKAKIDEMTFQRALEILGEHVIFVPEDFYSEFIPLALEICSDKDDTDFVALSLKVNAPPVEQRQKAEGHQRNRSSEHWRGAETARHHPMSLTCSCLIQRWATAVRPASLALLKASLS